MDTFYHKNNGNQTNKSKCNLNLNTSECPIIFSVELLICENCKAH